MQNATIWLVALTMDIPKQKPTAYVPGVSNNENELFRMKKKTIILIEVVSLILALLAWSFEWSSYKNSEGLVDDFQNSFQSIQKAHSMQAVIGEVKFEAAVSRYISPEKNNTISPLGNYALAWQSPEVREKWFNLTQEKITFLQSIIYIINQTTESNRLMKHPTIDSITFELDSINVLLLSKFGVPHLGLVPVDTHLPNSREAGQLKNNLTKIQSELLPQINHVILKIKENRKCKSRFYTLLFLLSSLTLIVSKILEWNLEKD